MLGAADAELLFDAVDAVVAEDPKAVLLGVERMARSGRDPSQFARDLLAHLRHLLVTQTTGEVPDTFVVTATDADRLDSPGGDRRRGRRWSARSTSSPSALTAVREGDDARMAVEIALLKAARPDLDPSTEGLLRTDRAARGTVDGAVPRPRVLSRRHRPTVLGGSASSAPRRTPAPTPPAGDTPPVDDEAPVAEEPEHEPESTEPVVAEERGGSDRRARAGPRSDEAAARRRSTAQETRRARWTSNGVATDLARGDGPARRRRRRRSPRSSRGRGRSAFDGEGRRRSASRRLRLSTNARRRRRSSASGLAEALAAVAGEPVAADLRARSRRSAGARGRGGDTRRAGRSRSTRKSCWSG